jgi:NAD(P)H-flavin reductase
MGDTTWLRNALRFALHATASSETPWLDDSVRTTGGDLADPEDPGKDPRFRALVEAILFSRRFLKTYNVVLLGILLLFTAWHWIEVLVLRRRTRRITRLATRDDNAAEAWSSSSSTIGETSPHRPAKPTEASPLLASRAPQCKPVGFWRPYYVTKALLQYQPRPIPVINKTLPTNATSLFVLAWLALIAFYNLYHMPFTFMYLFVFADRCGIIFIVNLPLLYLLAAKNQPIKWLTGYSYEALNIFHRRVGEVMCLEAFFHFVGMFAVWYGMLRHLGLTLEKFIFNRVVLLGLAAFIAYEVIYFTSLGSFRKRWYELFLALHVGLQVAGLVFLWFHHSTSRPYVGISLAIFLVDRVVYRMWLKSSTHPATLTILDDDETVLVSAKWDVIPNASMSPANMLNGWSPNQHIFISISDLGRTHTLQTHPFTIFSAAPASPSPTSDDNKHALFTLLIRPQSPKSFTHALLTHARTHTTTRIRLDGPYGSPHALSLLTSSNTAILIAGGSGIAVAYPLLYSLLSPQPHDPESPPPSAMRKVKLLWITHSPSHKLWLPDSRLRELESWGLDVLIPPPTALAGRPDVRDVLRGWVGESEGRTGVVVSGPEGLVRDVRNVCGRMVAKGKDVEVEVEKFGW